MPTSQRLTTPLRSRLPLLTLLRAYNTSGKATNWAWRIVGKDDSGGNLCYTLRSTTTGEEHREPFAVVEDAIREGILRIEEAGIVMTPATFRGSQRLSTVTTAVTSIATPASVTTALMTPAKSGRAVITTAKRA